ncbi:MAG: hypothetical protein ACRDOZ_12545, partial [Nocardioides sp.]
MPLRRLLMPLLVAVVLAVPVLGGPLTANATGTSTSAATGLRITSKAAGATSWPVGDAVKVA